MEQEQVPTPVQVERILRQAEVVCTQNGVRLTAQRRRVFQILCAQGRPMGAYELLDKLGKELPGARPPTVYRALAFLQEQGLVHRLESLNAYLGCLHPDHRHAVQFLICRDCGLVQELEDEAVEQILGRVVGACSFKAETMVVEVTGQCAGCARQ